MRQKQARQRPPQDWEGVVDKQIRDAIKQGDFERLKNAGKPLDLSEDAFTPRDWRLAYKILKDAGVAPEWIQESKELRGEIDALADWLARQARSLRERAASINRRTPDQMIVEYEGMARTREEVVAQFRERAAVLNKQIDTFNLKAPSARLHHPRIRIQEQIAEFEKTSR